MGTEKIVVQGISPIPTLDQFAGYLAQMAPEDTMGTDPIAKFAPKVEMMERFALGIYQWCIVDFATQHLMAVGGMVEEMTGKKPEYWLATSAEEYITELAHPEELMYWMGYVQFIYTYILQDPYRSRKRSLHPHIYHRMKNKDGLYRNIVTQFIDWIVDENGGVRYCLCQNTDLSHIKEDGPPQMVILEVNNGEHKLLISEAPSLQPRDFILLPSFTNREKEVMRLLAAGLTSKLIADALGIAKNTVENHRQRLLKKASCNTSSELISYAINNGLI